MPKQYLFSSPFSDCTKGPKKTRNWDTLVNDYSCLVVSLSSWLHDGSVNQNLDSVLVKQNLYILHNRTVLSLKNYPTIQVSNVHFWFIFSSETWFTIGIRTHTSDWNEFGELRLMIKCCGKPNFFMKMQLEKFPEKCGHSSSI